MKLFEGVYQIVSQLGDRVLNQYLLTGDHSLLVDTGTHETPRETTLPFMESVGLAKDDLTYAVNTHCDADHFGGNSELRHLAHRTLLVAHKADHKQIEDPEANMRLRYNVFNRDHGIEYSSKVKSDLRSMMGDCSRLDILLQGGETFRLSDDWTVEIFHVPGHTPGHIAVWDPKNRAIIIGDAIMGGYIPTADGKPALPPIYLSPDNYLSSIGLVKSLEPNILLTSHHRNMNREQAQKFFDESAVFVREAERQILNSLKASSEGLTLREMIMESSDKLVKLPEHAKLDLAFPFAAHLLKLEKVHQIRRGEKGELVAWKISERPRRKRRRA